MINGDSLVAMGFKPAKWFKEAIAHINKNNLTFDEMALYIESLQPPPAPPMIPLHSEPVKYFINLKATTELEKGNLKKVIETMDVLMRTPTVVAGAVMPDAMPAGPEGTIPVGGVVVTKNAIHPGLHSADICCRSEEH